MKPQIPRQRSRRAAMSRGRMYLKDRLGWLPGFPVCQEEGAVEWLCMVHRREQWLDTNIMTLLAELEPSLALRVLRQTRRRGVRRDEEERQNHRRTLLAQAHRALGCPIRAQRLMESGD